MCPQIRTGEAVKKYIEYYKREYDHNSADSAIREIITMRAGIDIYEFIELDDETENNEDDSTTLDEKFGADW